MLFPLFFPSSHFALYWGTLAIKKVDAFIPSEDSVSSCWAVFPWLFERVRLLPIASWIHTKNVQVERDLEDHQSTLPVTDKAIDPRSVKSQDLSRLTWPISASLEKNLPFLVSQCWALKKKRTGHLIAVAGHWHSMGVCRACLLGPSYYSLALLSWTFLNPPCLCPGKSDKGAFDFPAALCMQHSEKRGWQWGWEEEKTFVFQYWPDMKASLPGILRTPLNNGCSQDKR